MPLPWHALLLSLNLLREPWGSHPFQFELLQAVASRSASRIAWVGCRILSRLIGRCLQYSCSGNSISVLSAVLVTETHRVRFLVPAILRQTQKSISMCDERSVRSWIDRLRIRSVDEILKEERATSIQPALLDSATTVGILKIGPVSNAFTVVPFSPNWKPGAGE